MPWKLADDLAGSQAPILTAAQCRMARAALRLSTHNLALAATISYKTIARLEGGGRVSDNTRRRLREVLEGAGARIFFEDEWAGVSTPFERPG